MGPFGSLRGHHNLQKASKVKSDLRFEISDPNYILIHGCLDSTPLVTHNSNREESGPIDLRGFAAGKIVNIPPSGIDPGPYIHKASA